MNKAPHTHSGKEGGRSARPLGTASRIVVSAAIAGLLAFASWQTLHSKDEDAQPVDMPALVESILEDPGADEEPAIDWASIPETVVAWVEVPGTSIDEPIAQATADAPNRYLHADALGRGSYGTPYLDWECTPESVFSIVYGHHMDDGSVFADFARFIDRGYAEEHRSILVHTREEGAARELRVVAVDVVDASNERVQVAFADDDERTAYLDQRISGSDLVLEEPDLSASKVWAFATCSYQTSNSRTVVYAVEGGAR
ncbi:class B sortase [Paraeggerthella sp.]